jgi:hypothetical protein
MTSLPEDGERRPMALRQASDDAPAGGGACQRGPPALPVAEQDVSVRHSIYIDIHSALTTAARASRMRV